VHDGVGIKWAENERRRFATSYGISYTDREEEKPDPEKDRRLAGSSKTHDDLALVGITGTIGVSA
jgi:hypothetical protein